MVLERLGGSCRFNTKMDGKRFSKQQELLLYFLFILMYWDVVLCKSIRWIDKEKKKKNRIMLRFLLRYKYEMNVES